MTLPKEVFLRELGPREGLQTETKIVSLPEKLALIEALASTGVSEIEVTSFVRPDRIPQMADAEQLVEALPSISAKFPKTRFTALYLNRHGFERAVKFPQLATQGWIYTAASEEFLKRNNNCTHRQVLDSIPEWLELFERSGVKLHGIMVSAAFGSNYEGAIDPSNGVGLVEDVLNRIEKAAPGLVPHEISLADTMGWANPESTARFVRLVRVAAPKSKPALHLHDTRGLGMANIYAGLLEGVEVIDGSVAGVGGCPFAKGAAGNVPTDDVAFLCETLKIKTGVDLAAYRKAAALASKILGRELPGRYHRGGAE